MAKQAYIEVLGLTKQVRIYEDSEITPEILKNLTPLPKEITKFHRLHVYRDEEPYLLAFQHDILDDTVDQAKFFAEQKYDQLKLANPNMALGAKNLLLMEVLRLTDGSVDTFLTLTHEVLPK